MQLIGKLEEILLKFLKTERKINYEILIEIFHKVEKKLINRFKSSCQTEIIKKAKYGTNSHSLKFCFKRKTLR